MKIRIVLSVLLVLAIAIFYFSKPDAKENKNSSTSGTSPPKFRIGLTNIGCQPELDFLIPLNCNLWHKYTGDQNIGNKWYPLGWTDIGATNDL
ncbi:MAG: hypothetical protein NTU73_05770, partial [Ignavibacteriae bacterium]|nr:hypothetical protein [Ignavibacteriota bacterium]